MSIFRREVEPPPAKPAAPPRPAAKQAPSREPAASGRDATHIANGTKVVGEIFGKAPLFIAGVVEGSVRLESDVVIGDQGRLEGSVVAETVQVSGKMHGDIRGIKKVEVLSTGRLEGDVKSPSVAIIPGAFFKGKVEMTDDVGSVHAKASSPDKGPKASQGDVSSPSAASSSSQAGADNKPGAGSNQRSGPSSSSTGRQSSNSSMGRKGKGGR